MGLTGECSSRLWLEMGELEWLELGVEKNDLVDLVGEGIFSGRPWPERPSSSVSWAKGAFNAVSKGSTSLRCEGAAPRFEPRVLGQAEDGIPTPPFL